MIGFDIDGVLAEFSGSFTRICNRLHGTPIANSMSMVEWDFEAHPFMGISIEQVRSAWAEVKTDPQFWFLLEPIVSPQVFAAIDALPERCFITNRPGIDSKGQTERWLAHHGVRAAQVIVAADKRAAFQQLRVQMYVDDLHTNIRDALDAGVPSVSLLLRPYGMRYAAELEAAGARVVLSVEHFLQTVGRA